MKALEKRNAFYYLYIKLFNVGEASTPNPEFEFKSLNGIPLEYELKIKWSDEIKRHDQKCKLFQAILFAYVSKLDLIYLMNFIEVRYSEKDKNADINNILRMVCDQNGNMKVIEPAVETIKRKKRKKAVGKERKKAVGKKANSSSSGQAKNSKKRNRLENRSESVKKSKSVEIEANTVGGRDCSATFIDKLCSMPHVRSWLSGNTITATTSLVCFAACASFNADESRMDKDTILKSCKRRPATDQITVDYVCTNFMEAQLGHEVTTLDRNYDPEDNKRFEKNKHIHTNLLSPRCLRSALIKSGKVYHNVYLDHKFSPPVSSYFITEKFLYHYNFSSS